MIKRRSVLVLSVLAAVCVPALAEEETEYMAVLMEGKKVGYAIHTRSEEAGRVTTTDEASITVTRLGFPITIKMTETSVETSLEDFGADVDHRDRDSRLDRPEASEFGVDDRPEVEQLSEGDQSTLFADTTEDQQTLAGDDAAARCLFEE